MADYWIKLNKEIDVDDDVIVEHLNIMTTTQLSFQKKYFENLKNGDITKEQQKQLNAHADELLKQYPAYGDKNYVNGTDEQNRIMRNKGYKQMKNAFITFNKLEFNNSKKYIDLITQLHAEKTAENKLLTKEARKTYVCKKVMCGCGTEVRITYTTEHKQTIKHMKYQKELDEKREKAMELKAIKVAEMKALEQSKIPLKDKNGFTIMTGCKAIDDFFS